MFARCRPLSCSFVLALAMVAGTVEARTVYRCERDGTVSLSTAPEPGSRCEPREVADDAVSLPNLWGALGIVKGTLYERIEDGRPVYGTRPLPGSKRVLGFTVQTPPPPPSAPTPAADSAPARLDRYPAQFRAAARRAGVDEALVRAVAHAESGFDPVAVSPKGALGVMQLMPATARELGVQDPFAPAQSIDGGARHLRQLLRRYGGNLELVAAAYNAGVGAVTRHGGVPPYAETREYIRRVLALHARYRAALSAAGG
ncbi:lytic transglycosylase domain-containing protein [Lysobacter korlensis]|uniref:Lytic transglycosylase domain-containing protein n=1 Tax=Lysobacter korlensis TaxID=553636 RepID=A0ABV6RK66_9GAMM